MNQLRKRIKILWVCIFMLILTICFQRYENRSLEGQLNQTTEAYESLGSEFEESTRVYQSAIEDLKRGCK